jgi:hypothetical protein
MTKETANIANGRIKRNTNDYDNDLNPLLEKASNEQLQPLVDIITGTFSNWLTTDETYKNHNPNHVMYADLIASELRSFGGNSFANFARTIVQDVDGKLPVGPKYKEIVCDVAGQLKVNFNPKSDVTRIERAILEKILEDSLENTPDNDLKEMLEELGGNKDFALAKPAAIAAIMAIFRGYSAREDKENGRDMLAEAENQKYLQQSVGDIA